jgi:hypothetical protein
MLLFSLVSMIVLYAMDYTRWNVCSVICPSIRRNLER